MKQPLNDPVLTRFHAAVTEIYGDRVKRAILFGSRVRGDAKPDSDHDIAVFLWNAGSLMVECVSCSRLHRHRVGRWCGHFRDAVFRRRVAGADGHYA